MAIRIQFRRGTAAEWATANPVLAAGELGYESDTGAFKIGNATDHWAALSYGAVSQTYVDNALADVVGLAPEALDTLAELANAIGNDTNFGNTVTAGLSTLGAHIDASTSVHGIADTNALETKTGAQTKANNAQANAASYTDNTIAALISSSPSTLNTLNELAAALGDDPNFATTIATSLGNKINFVIDTAANFATANVVTAIDTLYIESDHSGFVRVGDGVTHYNNLAFIGKTYADNLVNDHANLYMDVHGISDTSNLAYQTDVSEVSNALSSHESSTLNVHGIVDTADLVLSGDLSAHANDTTSVHGIADTSQLVLINDLTAHSSDTTNVHGIGNTADLVVTSDLDAYATTSGPTFTGTVVLPSTTSIGDVSSTELSYVNGVTGAIQTQLDAKLASTTAATTYAPITAPTFTGNVVLPSTTTIGNVSGTEISYVDGVTSAIQTQLDAKAPIDSPTFTGTVSGITKSMVGLGNVTNTSDANKPVSTAQQTALDLKANLADPTFTGTVVLPSTTSIGSVSATELGYVDGVTSSIQTQIDAKLSKSGGTMTGALTLSGAPTSDLHAVTKQYADGLAAGINFHQAVVAATTGNLAGTYNNGTNGYGATLTKASNGSIGTIDGATVTVGDRILLRAQTDQTENGIYVITAVGSGSAPWQVTRAADADNNPTGELATGDFCFVTGGSTNIAKGFILTTAGTVTIGTSNIVYAQFNASEAVTVGSGLIKVGSTLSIGTAAITSDMILDGAIVDADINASAAIAQSKISGLSTSLGLKANLAAPSFTGGVTVDSSGIVFPDGTQTKAGVPSISSFVYKTDSYTLNSLSLRDGIIEVANTLPKTITIPADTDTNYPVGTSIDIIQTDIGQVTIANAAGVTVNSTPGLKLRTRWSSATLLKRAANTWIVYGDLTA